MNRISGHIRIKTCAVALILAMSLTFTLCACSGNHVDTSHSSLNSSELEDKAIKKNNKRVRKQIEDSLGFSFSDEFIKEAEMLMKTSHNASGANICIQVTPGKEEALLALIQSHLGHEDNIGANLIPSELDDQYATELRQMNPIKHWTIERSDSQKTNVYMARKGSFSYVYIFT